MSKYRVAVFGSLPVTAEIEVEAANEAQAKAKVRATRGSGLRWLYSDQNDPAEADYCFDLDEIQVVGELKPNGEWETRELP